MAAVRDRVSPAKKVQPVNDDDEPKSNKKKTVERTDWLSIIHTLAEFYHCDWDEVTNWNVYLFFNKLKFRNKIIAEQNLQAEEQAAKQRAMNRRR